MTLDFCLLQQLPGNGCSLVQERQRLLSVPVDLIDTDGIEDLLRRPGVVAYCKEVLIPLRDIVLELHQFAATTKDLPPAAAWVRRRVVTYILLLVRLIHLPDSPSC